MVTLALLPPASGIRAAAKPPAISAVDVPKSASSRFWFGLPLGAVVFGISPDGEASHEKFKKKFDLPFKLLADEGHHVADEYGVWTEKSMYGRKYMGIERSAFLVDEKGKLAQVWYKISPKDTPIRLLEALAE